jgi:hypothetical protein
MNVTLLVRSHVPSNFGVEVLELPVRYCTVLALGFHQQVLRYVQRTT